jgi:hypothetical protein
LKLNEDDLENPIFNKGKSNIESIMDFEKTISQKK